MLHKWVSGSSSQVVLRVSEVDVPTTVSLVLEGQHATSTPQYVGVFGATTLSRMGDFYHPHQAFLFMETITMSGMGLADRLKGSSTFVLDPSIRYIRLDMNEFIESGGDVEKHMVSIALDRFNGDAPTDPILPVDTSEPAFEAPLSSPRAGSPFSSGVSELRYNMTYNGRVAGWQPSEHQTQPSPVVREATELLRLREAIASKREEIRLATIRGAHMESTLDEAVKKTQHHLATKLREHNAIKQRYEMNAIAMEAALKSN